MNEFINTILKKWKKEAKIKESICYKYSFSNKKLTIYTSKPGYLIGESAVHAQKYFKILKEGLYLVGWEILIKEINGVV